MSRVPSDKAAARAEAQRERILEAAQQCFIADGFHAATMATIPRIATTPAAVRRSIASDSYNKLLATRLASNAPASPGTSAAQTRSIASRSTRTVVRV